jgi:hypothetical protein
MSAEALKFSTAAMEEVLSGVGILANAVQLRS